jgi:acyl transferase domain-containing protein
MHKDPRIAVVGMDGIFPGAPDLETFWTNIVNGIDQSKPVPEERWIAPISDRLNSKLTPDHTYSRHACLIDDFVFDPTDFSLDPEVTAQLDPVHQLTLAAGKRAFKGCETATVATDRIDVILAAIALPTDSASAFSRKSIGHAIDKKLWPNQRLTRETLSVPEALASRVDGLPAALLSAELGITGNSFTLDAACASSMYALKLACDALHSNRADMVVSGGVSRPECLYTQTGFSQLQALSPSGHCSPFDRNADGLVVGEGVGILVLKRLKDAIDHKDRIHGVIHGIGLSNDMRGNLLAPESDGQLRAMKQAYDLAGWRPSDVDLIECHGTGTRAGDTTEIQSLVRLWRDEKVSDTKCAIGSVKSGIGHLLTAAGAAGMIKTLLAFRHRTLPPSIHYESPPEGSPLGEGPFAVQTRPEPWPVRKPETPRRAAVSAFGFGGINAHVLFEQWREPSRLRTASAVHGTIEVQPKAHGERSSPVAIVGIETCLGNLNGLEAFTKALLTGKSAIGERPPSRWKETDSAVLEKLDGFDPQGAYMADISIDAGEFRIPPNELNDILPQQLLALKVGAGAMADAGLALGEPREKMGVVVGIEFDFEATNYHLRWQLAKKVHRWNEMYGSTGNDALTNRWLENLRDQCSPPLTSPRVMGALGGIVASRMAREFRFGGPSFVVSNNAASGIQALQVALDLLKTESVEAMLVGAVDLAGEARSVIRLNRLSKLSRGNRVRPFDDAADGVLPGDGAVGLVLKRLDQAKSDDDRVYAVIDHLGSSGGGNPLTSSIDKSCSFHSLSKCFPPTGNNRQEVSLVMAHGTGIPGQDKIELDALHDFFSKPTVKPDSAIALGTVTPICGNTGAAQGLVSVAAAAICLDRRRLPPLAGFRRSRHVALQSDRFHVPLDQQPWYRDRVSGPRLAVSSCITTDGTSSHVLLKEMEQDLRNKQPSVSLPDVEEQAGLFVITGNHAAALSEGLDRLDKRLADNSSTEPIEIKAANWIKKRPPNNLDKLAIALVLDADKDHHKTIRQAKTAIDRGFSDDLNRRVCYRRQPMGADSPIAFLYPGSGNHYLGMGKKLSLRFPSIIEQMDQKTARLKSQFRPSYLMPWRKSWGADWEKQAMSDLTSDPLNMIFGQVVFGGLMTEVLEKFKIRPNALIGYSLGESAALFANGVWRDRGDMLKRMQATDLFTTQLAGPCQALRTAWKISPEKSIQWRVAVVNRAEEVVRDTLEKIPHTRLLIVNTPDECVIGGLGPRIEQAIAKLGCQAVFLDGVVTVHCDAAGPVADAYRDLHLFPVQPPAHELTVYSCSWAKSYAATSEKIADSIKEQAVNGFHFPNTILRAAEDGIGIFIEAGPRASCTRMIDRILTDRPHLAVAANHGNENEVASLLGCLARLAAERVPMDLRPLYEHVDTAIKPKGETKPPAMKIRTGGQAMRPTLPDKKEKEDQPPSPLPKNEMGKEIRFQPPKQDSQPDPVVTEQLSIGNQWKTLIEQGQRQTEETASAHQRFLELSGQLTRTFAETFDLQNQLLRQGARPLENQPIQQMPPSRPPAQTVAFDREKCMAFAIGKVGDVLGPAFDIVDSYRVRVRLPDEPLMLVDRILSVKGEMGSMGSGTVVTEHDVHPGAWYLDGDRAPVCISVEAGQADLFLSSYLGIDHQVKGERAYRLARRCGHLSSRIAKTR